MDEAAHIPTRYGFHTVDGFIDYFAHVTTLGPDDLEPEEFVPSELQWTLDDVFRGLELGYRLVARERGELPLLADCRRLTAEARGLYERGKYDEGLDVLVVAQRLIERLLSG
ncbi:MAG TPA: hypothetical protein VH475_20605 [Tepidisphaeraceae bacterium]|jgi:hypothetical protein